MCVEQGVERADDLDRRLRAVPTTQNLAPRVQHGPTHDLADQPGSIAVAVLERATELLDWRQAAPQSRGVTVETDAGACTLSQGGALFDMAGQGEQHADRDYPGPYTRFAALIGVGESDVDVAPLKLTANAFLAGRRIMAEPFHDPV